MTRWLLVLAGCLVATSASAQYPGQFPASTIYANPTGGQATPKPTPLTSDLAFSGGSLALTTHAKLSTSQLDKTTDTTFSNVPGLALALAASSKYVCTTGLSLAPSTIGGIKISFDTSDTLTVTGFVLNAIFAAPNMSNGSSGQSMTFGDAGSVFEAGTANITYAVIRTSIITGAAGTLVVRAGQAVSSGTSSVLINSSLHCVAAS